VFPIFVCDIYYGHLYLLFIGYKLNERGRCVCATDRNMIIDENGKCTCPEEHGYVLRNGYCEVRATPPPPGCTSDDDCPTDRFCDLRNGTCEDPCITKVCGFRAYCAAINHQAVCL